MHDNIIRLVPKTDRIEYSVRSCVMQRVYGAVIRVHSATESPNSFRFGKGGTCCCCNVTTRRRLRCDACVDPSSADLFHRFCLDHATPRGFSIRPRCVWEQWAGGCGQRGGHSLDLEGKLERSSLGYLLPQERQRLVASHAPDRLALASSPPSVIFRLTLVQLPFQVIPT